MIRLVQFGDLHLDSVFESSSPEKAAARRKASRQLLYDTVKYASDVNADIILCTGDLFDTNAPYYETLRSGGRFFKGENPGFYFAGEPRPVPEGLAVQQFMERNVHVFKEPIPGKSYSRSSG